MKQEKLDKIMDLYNRYWDSDEIDIDLANAIVDEVPELVYWQLKILKKKQVSNPWKLSIFFEGGE